jgi:hypothetical protein
MSGSNEEDRVDDLREVLKGRMRASDDRLDQTYREEGWGLMTDKAFGGRVRPLDVESQAREVARWAYAEIKQHVDTFNNQSQQLFEQDQEITRLNEALGKLKKEKAECKAQQKL